MGLIVNEAITNAIKYAFGKTENRKRISISLSHISDCQLVLNIAVMELGFLQILTLKSGLQWAWNCYKD
jgi:two-component sensor histidine kinase